MENNEYTKWLVDALEKNALITFHPIDEDEFGIKSDPIEFWGNILVEMSYWESKWNPKVKYKESFGVWSRGLFQLSKQDARYYKCDFTTEQSVHDPKANIECAVLIMEKLIKQDNKIAGKINGKWRGGARYWAVLRGTRDYTAKALAAIKQVNSNEN